MNTYLEKSRKFEYAYISSSSNVQKHDNEPEVDIVNVILLLSRAVSPQNVVNYNSYEFILSLALINICLFTFSPNPCPGKRWVGDALTFSFFFCLLPFKYHVCVKISKSHLLIIGASNFDCFLFNLCQLVRSFSRILFALTHIQFIVFSALFCRTQFLMPFVFQLR